METLVVVVKVFPQYFKHCPTSQQLTNKVGQLEIIFCKSGAVSNRVYHGSIRGSYCKTGPTRGGTRRTSYPDPVGTGAR